jgi:uncharacterized BrkB/YihY/UPF0761 family membrane protein
MANNLLLVVLEDRPGPASGNSKAHMLILKLILGVTSNVAFFALLLFLPAATLDWWRAWLLVGLVFIGTLVAMVGLARGHQGLLKERLKPPV